MTISFGVETTEVTQKVVHLSKTVSVPPSNSHTYRVGTSSVGDPFMGLAITRVVVRGRTYPSPVK